MPDYLVLPGASLEEFLEAREMSQVELARRTGLSSKTINLIISGNAPITHQTSLALEKALGVKASFWFNLQVNYDKDKFKLENQKRQEEWQGWIKPFPLKVLKKRGHIPDTRDKAILVDKLLAFFGVASPEAWAREYMAPQVAWRKSRVSQTIPEYLAAWLRMGELESLQRECAGYDQAGFKEALGEIRGLTGRPVQEVWPEVERLCAQAGVIVALVREFPGLKVNGATKWLSKNRALIMLTLRYKSNDVFWFSFFHEAAHILKHGKTLVFIENQDSDDPKEKEADAFAADFLIPPEAYHRLLAAASPTGVTKTAIRSLARELGIAPGIVVGRLQHEGRLPHNALNDLKVRLDWAA